MSSESYSSAPTEEEIKRIEGVVKDETQSSFFGSYEQLTPEEKKSKILERWKTEQTKSGNKNLPGFSFGISAADFRAGQAFGEGVGKIMGKALSIGTEALGGIMTHIAAESARKNAEIIAEVKESNRKRNERMQEGRRLLLSGTIRGMMRQQTPATSVPPRLDTQESIPVTSQQPVEGAETKEDTMPPSVHLENDTTTLLAMEANTEDKERLSVIAGQLNVVAGNESVKLSDEDPESAKANEEFYKQAAQMTERGDVDAALRFLDSNLGGGEINVWSDEVRASAVAMGGIKRELTGQPPADFGDVSYAVSKNAAGLTELQTPEDVEDGAELMSMLDRTNEPGEYGLHALEDVLDYSERILAFRTEMLNKKLNQVAEGGAQAGIANESEFGAQFWRREVEEAQRMRDAAFGEIEQRRAMLASEVESAQSTEGHSSNEQRGETSEGVVDPEPISQEKVATDLEAAQLLTDAEIESTRQCIDEIFSATNNPSEEELGISIQPEEQEHEKLNREAQLGFGHQLQRIVENFRDGEAPQSFADFLRSKPTRQQYVAATGSIKKIYTGFLADKRAPSEKIPEWKEKFKEAASKFEPSRMKFNDTLMRIEDSLGEGGIAAWFDERSIAKKKGLESITEQLQQISLAYAKDKRPSSVKAPELKQQVMVLAASLKS